MIPAGYKKCSKCQSILPEESFHKTKRTTNGYTYSYRRKDCPGCRSKQRRKNYEELLVRKGLLFKKKAQ